MNKKEKIAIIILMIAILAVIVGSVIIENQKVKIKKINTMVDGTWQAEVKFPDWKGYIDDTLAMNSMYSFDGYKDQGKIYFTVGEKVEGFDLFVNNKKVNTKKMRDGIFEVDISRVAVNGTNTIQVSNITPNNLEEAITVNIPYPTVIDGELTEVRFKVRTF